MISLFMNKGFGRNIRKAAAVIAVLISLFMLSLALTGCGKAEIQETSPAAETTADQSAAAEETSPGEETSPSNYPLTVTDGNGVEMVIQSEPRRIVSLTLGSDEVLMGLIGEDRIIALTRYADDPGISNIAPEASKVAERAVMDKIEKVIALNPDLVILDTWADANTVKQMRDSGLIVYAFKTPNNIEEQKAMVSELAHIVGADEKGADMIAWMDGKLKEVEDKLARIKPEQRLKVMDYGEMGSSGIGTNFDDIVTRAGLVNVVSEAGMEGWPTVSKEKIIELNPDIIILPSWYYDQKNSFESMASSLRDDKSLQTVKAISDNRLISVPNPHISAISQYVVLAVEDAAKAAYPELFE